MIAVIAVINASTVIRAAPATGPAALSILPPGEGNTVTMDRYIANQVSGSCGDLGPHFCDQLDMYKNWRFKDGTLSSDADHVAGRASEEDPLPGLRLVRDNFGVPHLFASGPDEQAIEEVTAYGFGYAQAEERLFQMEILRRAAEGRLAQLLGAGPNNTYLTMDIVTRRDSETDSERIAQVQALLTPGQQRSLQRYADGINGFIQRVTDDPSQMPAGFVLLQDLPISPWTVSDTVAINVLETHQIAESAGNELGYGALARRLAQRYGMAQAVAILNDVQLTGDPLTPTSVPHGGKALHTSDSQRYDFIAYTPTDTAARVAALDASVEPAMQAVQSGNDAVHAASLRLGVPHFGSNAWAVAPSRSSTGGALLWGGPQVSYYVPQVIEEIEVDSGLFHARGMGVPGGGPAIAIGYTPHTAWSITSAQDDQVDTYVDQIRRGVDGQSFEYLWRGAWRPVEQRSETIQVRANTPNLPVTGQVPLPVYQSQQITYYRTMHGPAGAPLPCVVSYIDTSKGLSYCKVRAFWGAELGTGLAIVNANKAQNLAQFDAAVRLGVTGFNFIYADDAGHIAYWHTGKTPIRVHGHDPRLPVPGDGSFDWTGFLDPQLWPSVVDPQQGFVVSWNNKPQSSWPDAGDGSLWGAYQRVAQPRNLLSASGPLDQTGLWQVARRTGELDLRATLGFKPFIIDLAGRTDLTAVERAAVTQVAGWDGTAFYPGGAERDASGNETGKVASPGFAIMQAWFHALELRAAAPVFAPVTGNSNAAAGVRSFTQTPGTTSPEFEFFDDYDAFLYNLMAGRVRGTDYLAGGTPLDIAKAALDDAVARLSGAQGNDPSRWRADMPQIVFQPLDVASIPAIPWENRGTWGQAVAFPTLASSAGSAPAPGPALPNTGVLNPSVVVLALIVVLAGGSSLAGLRQQRRSRTGNHLLR